MSSVESIPIPSERIPPIATDSSSSSKSVGGVLMFVFVIVALAMFSAVFETDKAENEPKNSAERAGHKVGTFIALVLFPAIPGWIGFKAIRNASRATKAAAAAQREPTMVWRLSGKLVIAADATGTPRPDLSFKISASGRKMLLAVPRAEVIDRS
jgi:hypothetical protein